jgi:Rnl2 family RNA ligase
MSESHIPYEKIPESLAAWHFSEADYRQLAKVDWVVTEKIHGANFAIRTDGNETVFAKRKEFLTDEEDFFGYHQMRPKLIDQLQQLWVAIQKNTTDLQSLTLYGELFGGGYPHPDIPSTPGVQPIQTGVWYTPDIAFCAFDLAIDTPTGRSYVDFGSFTDLCQQVGIFCTRALFIGSFEEALDFPVSFESTIPQLLGLPPLPDNKAEGIVLKPTQALGLGKIRPVLKLKIPQFAEDRRYHQATPWKEQHAAPQEDLEAWIWSELEARITDARLASVRSKEGRISGAVLATLLAADIIESFEQAWPDLLSTLNKTSSDDLQQRLIEYCNILANTEDV